MALWNLFSKRAQRTRGEVPDVYGYQELPNPLRVQVVHIWSDWTWAQQHPYDFWERVTSAMRRERGVFQLCEGHRNSDLNEFANGFLREADVERALDYLELSFAFARERGYPQQVMKCVEELNARLKEHGVGYEMIEGQMIRIDNTYLHQEAVKPALVLLQEQRFSGADAEFRGAHLHYREGRHEEALAESLKALESVLKVICESRGWAATSERLVASKLISRVFENELLPIYLQSEFTSVRALLESGVPTVRNREAGHGRGSAPRQVPPHLAAFALQSTAANILLLVEADKRKG